MYITIPRIHAVLYNPPPIGPDYNHLCRYEIICYKYRIKIGISIYLKEQSNNSQSYPYTQHLLQLESHTDAEPISLPPSTLNIITPLAYHQWEKALVLHPDRQFVQYLLLGIQKGFHIGVNRLHTWKQAKGNMHSALVHPTPVEDDLRTELQAGQIIGPIPNNALIQISRFGVIPKSGQPGNSA